MMATTSPQPGPRSDSDRVAMIKQRAAAMEAANQQVDEKLDIRTGDDVDRSWIARQIIHVFVGAVAIVLLLLSVQGYTSGKWSDVVSSASDLIKTAVLPIVTLVLGFYFGKSGKS